MVITESFVTTFLQESNAIENVHDEPALADAQKAWEYLESESQLTHDVIKRAHRILLENRQPDIAGMYRTVTVRVGNDVPPVPGRVEKLLENLLPVIPETAAEALHWHVKFEKIHPFTDGNGRIGRLVYLWHCAEHLQTHPILFREEDARGYYSSFHTAPEEPTEISL